MPEEAACVPVRCAVDVALTALASGFPSSGHWYRRGALPERHHHALRRIASSRGLAQDPPGMNVVMSSEIWA